MHFVVYLSEHHSKPVSAPTSSRRFFMQIRFMQLMRQATI